MSKASCFDLTFPELLQNFSFKIDKQSPSKWTFNIAFLQAVLDNMLDCSSIKKGVFQDFYSKYLT